MEKIPMTAAGYAALEAELKHRQQVERPRIIQQITDARTHGDLSENAEYHAAKEAQSHNEGRIAELEDKLARADVIDVSKLSGDTIKFGATVTLVDEDTDEKKVWQIVGEPEADAKKGKISITSPLARALIGKAQGRNRRGQRRPAAPRPTRSRRWSGGKRCSCPVDREPGRTGQARLIPHAWYLVSSRTVRVGEPSSVAAMKFGVFDHMDDAGGSAREALCRSAALVEAYDRAGIYGYHLAEHHATPLGWRRSPGLFLAAVAQRTKRLRFGPLVYLLPFYHPLRLIEEICMLDQMSGGRFELGVGRGVSPFETALLRLDSGAEQAMYHEAFQLLLKGLAATS